MNFKKVISLILIVAMVFVYSPAAFASESTATEIPEGYTAIYTKEDLKNVSNDLSGKYILMNDITFVVDDFIKTSEYPDRCPWQPLGPSSEEPFSGEFDGNGHSVEGIICIGNDDYYTGLFGYLTGRVKNLTVSGCNMSSDESSGYETRSGGVAAVVDGGSIENCHVTGTVQAKHFSGGIAGETHNAEIINCSNAAEIRGHGRTGGIVGIAYDSSIKGSTNSGSFTILNIDNNNSENCGGIVACGYNVDITECSNTAKLKPYVYYTGGIAGYLSGSVTDSYNTGAVNGFDSCGGIVGYMSGNIVNCYNTGKLSGKYYTGGIAGRIYGDISLSYNAGEIVAYFDAGGIAGNLRDGGSIKECYNTGKINEYSTTYAATLGGIVGYAYGGNISDVYNIAPINGGDAGGIAGRMDDDAYILNAYNIGKVTGVNTGAITGFVDNTQANITECVYHESVNELAVDDNVLADARALKTLEMYDAASYENFNFENIWMFEEGSEYPFPQLKNMQMHDGEFEYGFNLNPVYVEDLDIQMESEFTYTGNEIVPEIVITNEGTQLEENVDYTVSLSDNISAGTATAVINGLNEYEGSVEKTFTIKPVPGETCNVKLPYARTAYNGNEKNPSVTVTDPEGGLLTEETDYSLEYEEGRTEVGRYKVTVTFTGNYEGIAEAYFTIVPTVPKTATANLNTALKLKGYDDVKFSWSKVDGVSGYDVYFKKASASQYTYMISTTGTSVTKKDLSDGVKYTFKVVPFYKTDGVKYKSLNAKVASVYTLKKLSVPTVTKNGTKVKVKWKNINGETGYQISKAKTKTGTNIVATYKTTSGTYKNVSAVKGKKFYYKVRAYKVVNGKKVFGPWSATKAFTR